MIDYDSTESVDITSECSDKIRLQPDDLINILVPEDKQALKHQKGSISSNSSSEKSPDL